MELQGCQAELACPGRPVVEAFYCWKRPFDNLRVTQKELLEMNLNSF